MALDQQANWTISMAENLQAVRSKTYIGKVPVRSVHIPERPKVRDTEKREYDTPPVYLPDEIILEILSYVTRAAESQQTLYSCCLLSHQWYNAAIPLLYARPQLYGKNYDPFVRAVCPSINRHVRKSPLSGLVKVLNMSGLVHHGSKSMTARLLGRTNVNLEEFVAPQASFAINCYAPLSKCHKLRLLDLALVSESAPLQTMFNTVKSLQNLVVLRLPRSGFGADVDPSSIIWPPRLETLYLSGGIDANFLYGIVTFPPTLRDFILEHCPMAKAHAVRQLLSTLSQARLSIKYLRVAHMTRLNASSLDPVLVLFPALERLSVSVDYITPAIFNPDFQDLGFATPGAADFTDHSLRVLELTNSGNPGVEDKFSPIDIIIAMDEGNLPNLRQVRVAKSLGWQAAGADMEGEIEALSEQLQGLAKKDYEERRGVYEGMTREEYAEADWEKGSGVWMIDG